MTRLNEAGDPMPKITITDIVIPADRQREDMGTEQELNELADSIFNPAIGFLNPITLDRDHRLVAGMRRLTVHVMRGIKEIEFRYSDAASELEREIVELEENIRRKNLSWQEEAKAVSRIHGLKQADDPNWTGYMTAAYIGKSRRTVVGSVELTKEMESNPTSDVAKAKTLRGAQDRLKRKKQIKERIAGAQVRSMAEDQGLRKKVSAEVKVGDALGLLQQMDDASVDMVISNPPYGIDIEALFIGERTIYKDDEQDIVPLLEAVTKEVYRVLKDDRWFVWFYPTSRLEEGKRMLTEAGFRFQLVPCIWYKPNKFLSALSNPYQHFSSQYETFFWGRKGDPKFTETRLGNVFEYDTLLESQRVHPLQMPVGLWEEIVRIGSVQGEFILEPFSGSSAGGVACIHSERNYLGLELSDDFAAAASAWLSEEQTGVQRIEGSATVTQPTPISEESFELLKEMEFEK